MRRLIVPAAAALALSLGTLSASAQSYESKSTTVQTSPDDGTQTTTTTTQRDNGYGSFRKTVTSTRRYDGGVYQAPEGYTYTRYSIGEHVPTVLLASDGVVLNDYASYQLDAPPHGLKWIRVGSDAVLVDRRSGEVIQTDYNLFQ
jgi:Ni/Co efflux regulator RcnB